MVEKLKSEGKMSYRLLSGTIRNIQKPAPNNGNKCVMPKANDHGGIFAAYSPIFRPPFVKLTAERHSLWDFLSFCGSKKPCAEVDLTINVCKVKLAESRQITA